MDVNLGKWAVLDIETTGIDPTTSGIIDIGFLQFEGTKLVRTYSSLVRSEYPLSFFIQKLTGITTEMAQKAPGWGKVEPELYDLKDHAILAHNSAFEEKFLGAIFEKIGHVEFVDSLLYFGLMRPFQGSLSLEQLLIDTGIAESEEHRGLSDSLDLLRVMLAVTYEAKKNLRNEAFYTSLFAKFAGHNFWWEKFWQLSKEQLIEIAEQIEFDLPNVKFKVAESIAVDKRSIPPAFNGDNLKQLFQDTSKWHEVAPNYIYRPGQETMALKVGQSFQHKINALIQAPTGTGKTMAYLLPAALFAMEKGEKVLVATGTKALQKQVMGKEVPQLKKFLGVGDDLKVVELVGSNNHYCELVFRQNDNTSMIFEEQYALGYFESLFWHNQNAEQLSEAITRLTMPGVLKKINSEVARLDRETATDFRACIGQRCPFVGSCSYIQGLRAAKDAHLIIGNHALMFHWPDSAPRPEYIVTDEAHRLEGEATEAYSHQLNTEMMEAFLRQLQLGQGIGSLFYLLFDGRGADPKVAEIRQWSANTMAMIQDHWAPLLQQFEAYFKKSPRYTSQYWNELPMMSEAQDSLSISIMNHLKSLNEIISSFYSQIYPYSSLIQGKTWEGEDKMLAWSRFETFWSQLLDLTSVFKVLLDNDENYARSWKFHEADGMAIGAYPIDVGVLIKEKLLDLSSSVVFTSATLAPQTGETPVSVEWATGYSLLPTEKRYKNLFKIEATIDYAQQSKVFLSSDVPGIYDKDFVSKVISPLFPLLHEIGGRTLFLFSSYQRFEVARELLLKEFEGKIPLFIQGMGPNPVEEFKKAQAGLLVGLESFGEGIDVPGKSLEFVFIDKIPDLRQDIVIQERRQFFERKFGQEFVNYFLAHRAQSLHQKMGRLLRTPTDRGCIFVVDSRSKSWKSDSLRQFGKLMAPYDLKWLPYKEAVGEIERELRSLHGGQGLLL